MRVAIFTDTFTPQINGVTNTLNNLLKEFKKKNVQYLIFSPNYSKNDIKDISVERSFSFKLPLYSECRVSIPNKYHIEKKLIAFNPDVIQVMTEFNMGLMGLKLGKKLNIPLVSNYSTNFIQYSKYYNLNFLEKYLWEYMKWFHNSADLTVCPTIETKKLLKEKGINNIKIFSRGIDIKLFNPKYRHESFRKSNNLKDKTALLYVGRVSLEKNIDTLINAYSKLKEKYGDNITLTITGDGPELKNYYTKYNNCINFTGYLKGKKLSCCLASHDILIFPSTTETFGNVALEAMASGLPVIAAKAGGLKDVITNRVNGLHFNPGDSQDLYEKTIELIEDTNLRKFLKLQGLKTTKKLSWNSITDSLLYLYSETINNNKIIIERNAK